jgi:hypothetical protein
MECQEAGVEFELSVKGSNIYLYILFITFVFSRNLALRDKSGMLCCIKRLGGIFKIKFSLNMRYFKTVDSSPVL